MLREPPETDKKEKSKAKEKTKTKTKFMRSSSSSHSLGGGYDPDSWEALLLTVPMRKPAVLDDMSSK